LSGKITTFKRIGQQSGNTGTPEEASKIWVVIPDDKLYFMKDLQESKAIAWNINVSNTFYNCKSGDLFKEPGCDMASILGQCQGETLGKTCGKWQQGNENCDEGGCDLEFVPVPNACKAPLFCNQNQSICTCGSEAVNCAEDKDCSSGLYCNTKTHLCTKTNAALGGPCQADKTIMSGDSFDPANQPCKYDANGGPTGLMCDTASNKCVPAPKKCSADADCTAALGYGDHQDCVGDQYCDGERGNASACGDGFRLAENSSSLYNGSSPCLPLAQATEGKSCEPRDPNFPCLPTLLCDSNEKICVKAPPDCSADAATCKNLMIGWKDGECTERGGVTLCNCRANADCADGFRCAENNENSFGGHNSCVHI
jgi:hypothetical protein